MSEKCLELKEKDQHDTERGSCTQATFSKKNAGEFHIFWTSWLGDLSGEFDFSIKLTYLPKAPTPAPAATERNTFHPLTTCSLR